MINYTTKRGRKQLQMIVVKSTKTNVKINLQIEYYQKCETPIM